MEAMEIPIIYFCAVVNNGNMYWRDDRLYKTEMGARKRQQELQAEHPKGLVVLYSDDFKMA